MFLCECMCARGVLASCMRHRKHVFVVRVCMYMCCFCVSAFVHEVFLPHGALLASSMQHRFPCNTDFLASYMRFRKHACVACDVCLVYVCTCVISVMIRRYTCIPYRHAHMYVYLVYVRVSCITCLSDYSLCMYHLSVCPLFMLFICPSIHLSSWIRIHPLCVCTFLCIHIHRYVHSPPGHPGR